MEGRIQHNRSKRSKSSRRKFTTMMDPELRKSLKIIATQEDVSAADIIEDVLSEYIKEYIKKRPYRRLGLSRLDD